MDAYEATRIVFSRIQSLDPENASKIMGLLLIQDHGEKEMIRLAFGPESLLHSLVLKARNELGISSNTPSSTPSTTPSSSSSPFFSNNNSSSTTTTTTLSRQNSSSSSSSSRMQLTNLTLPSATTTSSDHLQPHHHEDHLISPNSASINNGFHNNNNNNGMMMMMMGPSSSDLIDEFQLQDQLSFLNDSNPTSTNSEGGGGGGMMFPSYSAANWGNSSSSLLNHRRSCSVTDMCLAQDPLGGSGFGWKPCLYYARGYCKNGTSCRFLHGLPDASSSSSDPLLTPNMMGCSPGNNNLDVMEQCQELLIRAKTQQQQQQLRLTPTSQLLASGSLPYTSVAGKCMNFLLQQQQQQQQNDTQRAAAAAALLLGEDLNKFRGTRMERNEFSSSGGGGIINPGSRQIYLTFPADSTFREEDVSNYFSIYGPVQDVRIPYQQKRMFGFVTFVYAETVKLILAKGNPHFVCDARVLVKPYKEKGKVPDKKQQQGDNRGEFSTCTTPIGLDSRDPYDLQQLGGARMLYNTQDMLFRRKLEEQAELQQAIDLQSRRLMSLQLLDLKKHHHHRNLSAGAFSVPSPTHSHAFLNQTLINSMSSPDRRSPEVPEENCGSPETTIISSSSDADQNLDVNLNSKKKDDEFIGDNNGNEEKPNGDCDFHDSLEHNLPDSPFASGGDPSPFFSTTTTTKPESERSIVASSASSSSPPLSSSSSNNNNVIASSLLPATSTLDMASFQSCFFQMPRFSSGHGAIEM